MQAKLPIAAAWDCEAASDATMLLTWRVEKEDLTSGRASVGASYRAHTHATVRLSRAQTKGGSQLP